MFANSPEETKTTAEKAFAQAFINQIGDFGFAIRVILAVVFFVLLLVAANTTAQAVRERTSELAVLKTLTPAEYPPGYGARWGVVVNLLVAALGVALALVLYAR